MTKQSERTEQAGQPAHVRGRIDNTRSAQSRTATLDRKAARTAKRFIVGGSK